MIYFKTLTQAMFVIASLVLTGIVQAADSYNLAITTPLNSHYGDGAKAFAKEIKRLSGGKFKVNIKPAAHWVGSAIFWKGCKSDR